MKLKPEQLDRFKEIYLDYTGVELTDDQAMHKAINLFYMLKPILGLMVDDFFGQIKD